MDNTKNIKPIKYWCNKVLPLVYDDSLSYYELLSKLTYKMNEIIEAVNSNFEELIKDYVDKYFNTIMFNAIYDEDSETITILKETTSSTGDTHTYNFATNTMKIE